MVPTTGVETGDWPLVSKNVNLEKVIPNVIPPWLSHSHSRKIDYSVVAHITVIGHGWPISSFSPEQFLYSVGETYRGADVFLSLSISLTLVFSCCQTGTATTPIPKCCILYCPVWTGSLTSKLEQWQNSTLKNFIIPTNKKMRKFIKRNKTYLISGSNSPPSWASQ